MRSVLLGGVADMHWTAAEPPGTAATADKPSATADAKRPVPTRGEAKSAGKAAAPLAVVAGPPTRKRRVRATSPAHAKAATPKPVLVESQLLRLMPCEKALYDAQAVKWHQALKGGSSHSAADEAAGEGDVLQSADAPAEEDMYVPIALEPWPQPPTDLNLNHCALGDAGAEVIADALSTDHSVETLWLCGNGITRRGALCLAAMVRRNQTLSALVLSDNIMADDGTEALFRALPLNSTLTELNLSSNLITSAGCVHDNTTCVQLPCNVHPCAFAAFRADHPRRRTSRPCTGVDAPCGVRCAGAGAMR